MSDEFQNNIQSWVSLDNRIKNLSQQVKNLRSQRNTLTSNIFTYAESNNLENAIMIMILALVKLFLKLYAES